MFAPYVLLLLLRDLAAANVDRELVNRDLVIAGSTTLSTNWTYLGCYNDPGNPRTLNQASYTDYTSMTEESCVSYCNTKKYAFAGIEFTRECYCGNYLTKNVSEPASDCNMPCTGNSSEICGGSSRMSIFWNGQTPPSPPIHGPGPKGWSWQGCYTEGTNGGRTLTTQVQVPGGGSNMSVQACTNACASYAFAGVEYSQECYCGNIISNGGSNGTVQDCNMICSGNSSEFCGGSGRLDLYQVNLAATSTSTSMSTSTSTSISSSLSTSTSVSTSISVSTSLTTSVSTTISTSTTIKTSTSPAPLSTGLAYYTYLDCHTDSVNSRTLTSISEVSYSMTLETCALFCGGYLFFGLEFGRECFCGNSLSASSTTATDGRCNMACLGDSTETCGGPNGLSLYGYSGGPPSPPDPISSTTSITSTTVAISTSSTSSSLLSSTSSIIPSVPSHVPSVGKYTWLGCYTDAIGARALTDLTQTNHATMTVELCAAFCSAYPLFGVEYSGECYCGNTLKGGSTKVATTDCSNLCDGNKYEYCGGGNRMDLYSGTASAPLTTTASTSETTTSTTVSISTTLPTGWVSAGCWVDQAYGRIMQYEQPNNPSLTVESCVKTCASSNYTVAGVEFGVQCFCGYEVINAGTTASNQGDCSQACGGDAAEFCGGGNRMNVYHTGSLKVIGVPVPQTGGLGDWTYKGCRTDNVQNRALPWNMILLNNNSAANCLGQCQKFGYTAGALQWGQECYCGDPVNMLASSSMPALESECGSTCTGNVSEICGGALHISYYEWTGTPPNVWHTPTGSAMGEYRYILDSPVVALISTPAINGKITFIEKFGTSGTPGSTGAYELDLFYENNTSAAWRTMHVKSDVFCSASLTLPDKGGRQINVGGWNYDSVWGVRTYLPDGAPGQPSVNEWEENYSAIHLLAPRWYPTAMILTNGSILIIGGEEGPNGAPSPNLEILPATGGGLVHLEWLARTDPLNLYPFLTVLPSGNIFVAYYNEARILEPVNFNTIRQLPNMPGCVNDFTAGRTYPLEGTMMLLPQYAPYTSPLSIIICGGSSSVGGGGAMAIDNCVSTQPDNPSADWVLERMPSQRTMISMAALPDGTYLIVNGAQRGEAGFGLASLPNLQAVLYDPNQPIGSRFSLMATTTIARMYHNEAVLLQDGRVLITGSDPQDAQFPQEYRVEVFLPPYLLNGATRPSFTIQNKDWSYSQKITINVNLPSGNALGARVSLLGATSATHGNSMGQRTIFPAVTCTTTTCTITAPPGANICPPGWFQLFLLDGPTPSNSIWVRIGGDPAELGNWPKLPGFKLPGV